MHVVLWNPSPVLKLVLGLNISWLRNSRENYFDDSAWSDYLWWQVQDRKVLKRINLLIKDVERNGNEGIGKPEALRHQFSGWWSRRITDEHRLVYKLTDDSIVIASCRYHYGA